MGVCDSEASALITQNGSHTVLMLRFTSGYFQLSFREKITSSLQMLFCGQDSAKLLYERGTDVGQTPEGAVYTPNPASCTLTEPRVSDV